MAEGRQQERWNHTSAILAMLANVNRDPRKGRLFKPAEFHPLVGRVEARQEPSKGNIRLLKAVFVDRQDLNSERDPA